MNRRLLREAIGHVLAMETEWRGGDSAVHGRAMAWLGAVQPMETRTEELSDDELDAFHRACNRFGRWLPFPITIMLQAAFNRRHPAGLDGVPVGLIGESGCTTCDLHATMEAEGMRGGCGAHLCTRPLAAVGAR